MESTKCDMCEKYVELEEKYEWLRSLLREYTMQYKGYSEVEVSDWLQSESIYRTFRCESSDYCEKYESIIIKIDEKEKKLKRLLKYMVIEKSDELVDLLDELREHYPLVCEYAEAMNLGLID